MQTPQWGFVAAKPSEYLVCTRDGQVDRTRSGQGARIFKWPRDQVAIVPTTLQRIEFTADQITREKVGVCVSGLAVVRIAEPLLAYRVLDFTEGDAADKLAATLREMFVGAGRRLIANLTLDDCLSRRKETIAGFLLDEIAPIVGGEGKPDDSTNRGWGVVIDTIEIKEVKILSAQVFAHLQAPYRAEIATRAELAGLERKREVAEREAETTRRADEAQVSMMRATRELKAKAEAEATEVEAREAARRAEMNAAGAAAALESRKVEIEASHRAAALELAHERELAELRDAQRRRAVAIDLEVRQLEAEARDRESQLEAAAQRRLAEIEQLLAQSRALRDLVTTALPQIAQALHQQVGTLNYTSVGGDRGPLDAVPSALAQLLALAKSFGLQLPGTEAAPPTA